MGCGGCRKGITINLDKQAKITAPIMDSDGSIVYPEGEVPPEIEGYKPTKDDPQRLSPREESACVWKITGIMMQRDGTYKPLHVCRSQECKHKSKPVSSGVCQACPHRETQD